MTRKLGGGNYAVNSGNTLLDQTAAKHHSCIFRTSLNKAKHEALSESYTYKRY